jgi:glycosyltransferase involved in cell wall biosynthesis
VYKLCYVVYNNYKTDARVRRSAETMVEAGHSVDVISLHDENCPSRETINGVHVYRTSMGKERGGSVITYIVKYLLFLIVAFFYVSIMHLRKRYHLIHVNNMPNFLVFCAILPKVMQVPVILDVHDVMPELFSSVFAGKGGSFIYRLLLLEERISFCFADQLIVVSKSVRDLLIDRGINPSSLVVIHNLPDPAIFGKAEAARLKKDTFTLVYAGSISNRNRLDLVLHAISDLKNEMPDLRIKVVGPGPDIPRLKDISKQYQIEDRVEFKGAIPVSEIPDLLTQCDAAIVSQEDDTFGRVSFSTKTVEAIMVGLPALCPRLKVFQDYFDDSILFYYKPGDANSLVEQIRLVRYHPELVETKLKNGHNLLSFFNWNNEKIKLINLVQKLCKQEANFAGD